MPDGKNNGSYQAQETVTSIAVTVTAPQKSLGLPKSARIAQKAAARSCSFGQVNAAPHCSRELTREKACPQRSRRGFRQDFYGMTRTVTREVFVALSLTISVRTIA
jgi:hypothetical protein